MSVTYMWSMVQGRDSHLYDLFTDLGVTMFSGTEDELGKISDDEETELEAAGMTGAVAGGSELQDPEQSPTLEGADKSWPTVADLNTRLRRVISSYQRNFKREEMKLAQKAKV
jgi:hypothetical protein